ncbi:MAG: 1-deoxy-D-xylulose-5-phosphate reductoisomerase [Candidatus Hydrogenedentota bacterium]
MRKKVVILGSTGSIGRNTLEVINLHKDRFQIKALVAGSNARLLIQQFYKFKPELIILTEKNNKIKDKSIPLKYGIEYVLDIVKSDDVDIVVSAFSGVCGLLPTYEALKSAKRVALANKEVLVSGGKIIKEVAEKNKAEIIPIDSEHSAVFQCIQAELKKNIEKIILTASGGPFRKLPLKKLKEVTVQQALNHPTWNMGKKITIDSATMMNKGFEVIEACYLFDMDVNKIEVVIHPQSIIHSLIETVDGSLLAQLGPADMKLPIQYALSYPERLKRSIPQFSLKEIKHLNFEEVDFARYPCLKLAYEAMREGGTKPCVLNVANDKSVVSFLQKKIKFTDIPLIIENALADIDNVVITNISDLLQFIDFVKNKIKT